MVVSLAIDKLQNRYPEFSELFFAERIRLLAKQGRLESQGNLRYMRFSEVRLPDERWVVADWKSGISLSWL